MKVAKQIFAEPEYHSTPKSFHTQMYYETIHLITIIILQRFDQPLTKFYKTHF